MILTYNFDDESFDYEVESDAIKKALYEWLLDEWSHDEFIDFILSADGCTINIEKDFEEIIYELFEDDAMAYYYEMKNSDNGVSQEDFV